MRTLEFHNDINSEAQRVFNLRETLRGNGWCEMPTGPQGLVVEDLDLIVRWYGPRFGLDAAGRSRAIELKSSDGSPNMRSKEMVWQTFGWHEKTDTFDGVYVVYHEDDKHNEDTRYWINDLFADVLDAVEFRRWILNPYSDIPDYFTYKVDKKGTR